MLNTGRSVKWSLLSYTEHDKWKYEHFLIYLLHINKCYWNIPANNNHDRPTTQINTWKWEKKNWCCDRTILWKDVFSHPLQKVHKPLTLIQPQRLGRWLGGRHFSSLFPLLKTFSHAENLEKHIRHFNMHVEVYSWRKSAPLWSSESMWFRYSVLWKVLLCA